MAAVLPAKAISSSVAKAAPLIARAGAGMAAMR